MLGITKVTAFITVDEGQEAGRQGKRRGSQNIFLSCSPIRDSIWLTSKPGRTGLGLEGGQLWT